MQFSPVISPVSVNAPLPMYLCNSPLTRNLNTHSKLFITAIAMNLSIHFYSLLLIGGVLMQTVRLLLPMLTSVFGASKVAVSLTVTAATTGVALAAPLIASSLAVAQDKSIVVASTTSTQESGLFGHILPLFTKKTGIAVKVVALGTGQALDVGRRGDADVVEAAVEKGSWLLGAHVRSGDAAGLADLMRSNGKIYVVIAVMLTILFGLIFYLVRLDKKITRLEKDTH